MGIVHSAFITTTCSKLLLWFAMLVMLPHTHTAMLDIHMPTPPSPDTVPPTEPMDMLVSHTLDTLPMVLTHMPTELTHMLMMPTTDTTDMPDLTPTDMPHMLMELTHTVMDMPGESKLFQPKVLSYCKPKAQ